MSRCPTRDRWSRSPTRTSPRWWRRCSPPSGTCEASASFLSMSELVMPRLSDSMEEGTIVRWLVEDGASVARGDDVVEIETDKATMTYSADADGVLRIVASEGDTLPIGAVIASIGGDRVGVAAESEGASPAPVRQTATPSADASPASAPADAAPETDGAPAAAPTLAPSPPPADDGGERVKASPVARRIARERGVGLGGVGGRGSGRRLLGGG